jgi:hypothetical protein
MGASARRAWAFHPIEAGGIDFKVPVMNKTSLLFSFSAITLLSLYTVQGQVQNLYHIKLTGMSTTTDQDGHFVHQPINNQTLLQEVAKLSNLTNTSWLGLAYHVGGNDLGDTIDVIARTNGAVQRSLFGLYFGEDPTLGRTKRIGNDNHTKRIEYIYTYQNSHSLGSVVLNDFFSVDGGTTNHSLILGTGMQWLVLPDSIHPKSEVRTGSFIAEHRWAFGSN